MQLLNRLYIKGYLFSIMLYAFFNKGIAYSYLAEIFLFIGVFLLIFNRKKILNQFSFLFMNNYIYILFLSTTLD